ncbi:hypothetical protein [Notoacmeibacter marinus]|uniref:hypothetical protein n=1 Tax=Notoacmeibacter marinus TaxID=1876515 RepID=UPI000DF18C20|nr:hypothetical protein [Notoacmeibacter marinus]
MAVEAVDEALLKRRKLVSFAWRELSALGTSLVGGTAIVVSALLRGDFFLAKSGFGAILLAFVLFAALYAIVLAWERARTLSALRSEYRLIRESLDEAQATIAKIDERSGS